MYPFFLDLINENFPEGEVLKKPGKDHLKENNNSVLITKNTFKESVRDFIVVVLMFFFTSTTFWKSLKQNHWGSSEKTNSCMTLYFVNWQRKIEPHLFEIIFF